MSLADIITVARLGISVVFVAVCSLGWDEAVGRAAALVLALVAEATDLADGYVARRQRLVSDTGKLLDPYADKIWRFSAFLCIGMRGYADLWMVALIFWRLLTVSHLRTVAVMRNRVIAARVSGKVKAVIQGVGIIAVLGCAAAEKLWTPGGDAAAPFRAWAWWIMLVVTVATFLSVFDYARAVKGRRGS